MPRKKQDKPQHLDHEQGQRSNVEQSAMKQSNGEHLEQTDSGTSRPVGENCDDMTSANRCSPVSGDEDGVSRREDGDSLEEEEAGSSDIAVISKSEWLRVKTSLSSIQQLLQVMRLQQFQIMQLLAASKSPSPASTTTNNINNVESSIGVEDFNKEDIEALPAESVEGRQLPRQAEVVAAEEPVDNTGRGGADQALVSTSAGDTTEDGTTAADDGGSMVGDGSGSKMGDYADRDSSTNADSDTCEGDQDEGEPESYDCSKCSAVLPTPELLKIHQLSHGQSLIAAPPGGETPRITSTSTSSSQYLTSQERSIHDITPPTSLPPSYQSVISDLTNDDSLEEYMEIQKPENTHLEQLAKSVDGTITDPNQCLICKRILSCKSALMMHYRTHTGERPFKCKLCSRAFTTKGNLKTHMGVHRAKPPVRLLHSCPICNKQFTNALVLNQHMKIHSDEAATARKRGLHDSPSLLMMEESKRVRLSLEAAAIKNEINDAYTAAADLSKKQDPFAPMSLTAAAGLSLPFDMPGVIPPMSNHLRYAEALARQWEQLQQLSMFNPLLPPNPAAALFSAGVGIPGPTPPAPPLRMPLVETSHSNVIPTTSQEKMVSIPSCVSSNPSSSSVSLGISAAPSSSQVSSDLPSNTGEEIVSPSTKDSNNFSSNSPKSEKSWGSGETNNTSSGSMKLDPPPGTTCDLCPKTFACRSALEIHYRSHTKQRPFKCALCGKAFTTRGNMKQHVLTHKTDEACWPSHERTTPCPRVLQQPGYSLDQSVTTAEDAARKTNTKHQCSVCLKHFSSASAVQIHFRTHTGDRPFKCVVCGKAFTTKGNLKVHMGTHMAPQMWNGSPPQQGPKLSGEGNGINPEIASQNNKSPQNNNNFIDWSAVSQASTVKAPLMSGQHPFMPSYPMFLHSGNAEDGTRPWFWQVTCHLCNKECASPAALELHIKTHAMNETKPKPMVAS